MKTSLYFCYISVIFTIYTTSTSAYPKSSNDNQFSLSKDDEPNLYPVKRKVPNPEPPSFVAAHEEEPDFDPSSVSQPIARYRRNHDRKSKAVLEKELELKRTSLLNGLGKRADRLYKRDLRPPRREEAYGIVYGNGRPIGILEPFPQAYELAPMYNAREGIEEIEPLPQVNPRSAMDNMMYTDRLASNARGDWENNENNVQDSSKYSNDKYPAVLNDYKITNRVSNGIPYKRNNNEQGKVMKSANSEVPVATKRDTSLTDNQNKESSDVIQKDPELVSDNLDEPNKVTEVKRSTMGITNEKIDKLKSALTRMQNPGPSDKVEEIEDSLRDILSDMGLIEGEYNGMDAYKNKRDSGSKRDIDKEDENLEEGINKIELVKVNHEAPVVERNKREDKKETNAKTKTEIAPETSINKDQEVADNSNNPEPSELKVAGEASPVSLKSDSNGDPNSVEIKTGDPKINVANYQSEGDAYIRSKRQETNDIMKGLEKSGDLTISGNKSPLACSGNDAETEKKRNKEQTSTASSISDKAKREQTELDYQKEIEQNIQAKIDAIKEQVKREIEALKTRASQENQRRKRDVNTLLAEESSDLDPQKHPDEKLIPHIRRRRNLEDPPTLTRAKRGLPDFSNLKNIDSGDYLELTGERQRSQRETLQDYEVDPQENKYLPEALPSNVDDVSQRKRSSDNQVGPQENKYDPEALPGSVDDVSEKKRSSDIQVDPQENRYVPEAFPGSVDDVSEKKRSSDIQEGLPAAETAHLNVNNDDSNSQNDETNIQERSVHNPSTSVPLIEKKSAEALEKEIKEPDLASQSQNGEKLSQDIKNEEQANVASIVQEIKSNDDNSVQKRSTDQVFPEENSSQNEMNTKTKNKSGGKKEGVEETANVNNPDVEEDQKSKRDVKISAKSDDTSGSKVTEEPTLTEKKISKRNIEDASLNLKSSLEPEEEDLQETANSRRMRRQIEEEVRQNPSMIYGRRKRANAIMPYAKSSFFPYRAEEEDGDDEGDEFEEDSFEDRSNLQKREAGYNSRYNNQFRRSSDYQQDYGAPEDYSSNYQPEQKRSLASRYVANENSDVYENPNNYLYHPVSYVRQKRQNFDQLASLHGGGPMLHHLAAVRERSMQQLDDDTNRNKRNFNRKSSDNQKSKEEPENIADLSAADLFGALPQSYDGNNLLRFKRIKRGVPSSIEKTQNTSGGSAKV